MNTNKKKFFIILLLMLCFLVPVISVQSVDAKSETPAKKCYLSVTKKTIKAGTGFTLKLHGTKIKKVTSDAPYVLLDQSGYIFGMAASQGTITVKGTNNKSYKCEVTVKGSKQCNPYMKTDEEYGLVGDTIQLKLYGYSGKLTWVSSNKSLVKVDKKGKVTILKADKSMGGGGAIVYPCVGDGSGDIVAHGCGININAYPQIKFDTLHAPSSYGDSTYWGMVGQKWKAISWGTGGKRIWKSSKPSVAKVDSKGNITALRPGKVTISAQSGNMKLSKTIRIESKWVYSKNNTVRKKTFYDGSTLTETKYSIPGSGRTVWGFFDKNVAKDFLTLTNRVRISNGYKAYTWSEELYTRSQSRALYHAAYLSEFHETGIYFESGTMPMTAQYAFDYMFGHSFYFGSNDPQDFAIACFYHDSNPDADRELYLGKYKNTSLFTVMNGLNEDVSSN